MRRRALLAEAAGVTSGLTGCLSGGEDQETVIGGEDPTMTETATTTQRGEPEDEPAPDIENLPAKRWYPSAHLAPVSDPYIFHWYGGSHSRAYLREHGGIDAISNCIRTDTVMSQRDQLTLTWYGSPHLRSTNRDSKRAYSDHLATQAKRYNMTDSPHRSLGLAFDEWPTGGKLTDDPDSPMYKENPYGLEGTKEGIRRINRIDPRFFVAVYVRGTHLGFSELVKDGVIDLAMITGPQNKRIDRYRELGHLDRTIGVLGYSTNSRPFDRIGDIRDYAPKMPGIGFWDGGINEIGSGEADAAWFKAVESTLREEFIDPAPQVQLTSHQTEQRVEADELTLEAEATPKGGRSIREYRWFVDNRLVEKTDEPAYVWDTTHVRPGRHTLTVHAIDDGWNRRASQIPVRVNVGG